MRLPIACLAAVLPLFAGQPGGPLAPISIYTQFSGQPPAAVLEAVESEVQSIMAPMGLSFKWLNLRDYDREVAVELAVINFKGRCDVAGLIARDVNPGALGWTHISDGAILPFADVDCSAIRGFLQKELYFTNPHEREQVFGRALGRVLAHELYHIFANTTHHGADGVARESYSTGELTAPDFQFEARESLELIHSKVHAALATAAAPAEDTEPRHRP